MYTKHGNLVDTDASGAKASTKHLESHLEVIQGHAFWVTEKSTRKCVLLWALESKISKERPNISVFIRHPLPRKLLQIFAQFLYF